MGTSSLNNQTTKEERNNIVRVIAEKNHAKSNSTKATT
jgi:hypothetical protein